ncbi:hypothetical protein IQ07DRAFT_71481 [Pyrenochaeta sp. DS3sAY3a]|nr:hypothetical protein IQ07DRAFT_71481 [Pyrenochaeta sp. DS3sAY3a]
MWPGKAPVALSFVALATAAPQALDVVTNTTTSAPAPPETCEAKCTVYYPQASVVSWIPVAAISFTTELTVGTANVVIYTTEGSAVYTTTQTVYDSISQDYDLYRQFTDDSGTVFVELPPKTISNNVVYSELAYPTQLIEYDAKYSWDGVLPTSGETTVFSCATATSEPSIALLPNHPPFPPPTNIVAEPNDPGGQEHQPIWVPLDINSEYSFFKNAFPSESAFLHCESAARSQPTTTIYSMPRFVLDHTTMLGRDKTTCAPHGRPYNFCCRPSYGIDG